MCCCSAVIKQTHLYHGIRSVIKYMRERNKASRATKKSRTINCITSVYQDVHVHTYEQTINYEIEFVMWKTIGLERKWQRCHTSTSENDLYKSVWHRCCFCHSLALYASHMLRCSSVASRSFNRYFSRMESMNRLVHRFDLVLFVRLFTSNKIETPPFR